jgi:hypothetical protein
MLVNWRAGWDRRYLDDIGLFPVQLDYVLMRLLIVLRRLSPLFTPVTYRMRLRGSLDGGSCRLDAVDIAQWATAPI